MNDYSKDMLALYHKAKANNKAHEALVKYHKELNALNKKYGFDTNMKALSDATNRQHESYQQLQLRGSLCAIDMVCRTFLKQARDYSSIVQNNAVFPDKKLGPWLAEQGFLVKGHTYEYDLWTMNEELRECIDDKDKLYCINEYLHVSSITKNGEELCKLSYFWPDSRDGGDTVTVLVSKRIFIDLECFLQVLTQKKQSDYPEPETPKAKQPEKPASVLESLPPEIRNNKDALQRLVLELINGGYVGPCDT